MMMLKTWMCMALVALAANTAVAMKGMEGMGGGAAPGGWSKTKMTHELKSLLITALTKGSDNYADGVDTRVCVTQLKYAEQQVVAGMNYRFHVMGCDVGSWNAQRVGNCAGEDAKCEAKSYVIKVFEQSWTDTLQVTGVYEEGAVPKTSGEVSDEEKNWISMWIKKNKLNRFGDKKGTYYTGGTPLFNETTGESVDRFVYIIRHHPDRPWVPVETAPMEGMVKAAPLNLAAKATASQQQQKDSDSYIEGLATFGVLTVLIAAVAFLKARRSSTRSFNYDTVNRNEIL